MATLDLIIFALIFRAIQGETFVRLQDNPTGANLKSHALRIKALVYAQSKNGVSASGRLRVTSRMREDAKKFRILYVMPPISVLWRLTDLLRKKTIKMLWNALKDVAVFPAATIRPFIFNRASRFWMSDSSRRIAAVLYLCNDGFISSVGGHGFVVPRKRCNISNYMF